MCNISNILIIAHRTHGSSFMEEDLQWGWGGYNHIQEENHQGEWSPTHTHPSSSSPPHRVDTSFITEHLNEIYWHKTLLWCLRIRPENHFLSSHDKKKIIWPRWSFGEVTGGTIVPHVWAQVLGWDQTVRRELLNKSLAVSFPSEEHLIDNEQRLNNSRMGFF